jgi:hypothetical protein
LVAWVFPPLIKEFALAEKKTCFIIMPITTPESFLSQYRDGIEHFNHVLECLFIPSVEKAGYTAIPPIAKGADLIHAEIIQNLWQSDLVFCDISCPNPNVFFELGIRTALNKPVCIVKDELTNKIPFDLSILNYREYMSTLQSGKIQADIDKLVNHIGDSVERSNGVNTLWKQFGSQNETHPYMGDTSKDTKIDNLTKTIESLKEQLANDSQREQLKYASSALDVARIYE